MQVKILLNSINPFTGVRLTTLHCEYPQFIHQQLLTHRMFSRNSSSLRAISFERASKEFEVVYPTWTLEKKGMQGNLVIDGDLIFDANQVVDEMNNKVQAFCTLLEKIGIHHQDINNYLRPFQNIHTVITATDWQGFFDQRLHESTKPDMQKLAQMIYEALDSSNAQERVFHIPLLKDNDFHGTFSNKELEFISAARLARISYFKWSDDPNKDLELAHKLIKDNHPSPFEHIAFAQYDDYYYANFKSWKQLRHSLNFGGK